MAEQQYYEGIGRRKTSTARVRLHIGGTGGILVNDKTGDEYFTREQDNKWMREPLKVTGSESRYNVTIQVSGGESPARRMRCGWAWLGRFQKWIRASTKCCAAWFVDA